MYLNYAVEVGVFGAAAFLWYFFGTMIQAFWKAPNSDNSSMLVRAFRLGIGLALLSVAFGGLTDDVLFNIPTSMLLWMLCGLGAAAREITPQKV